MSSVSVRFVALLVTAAAAAAVSPSAGMAATNETLIPVKVTFAGSGTFGIDETYLSTGGECTVTTHDVMALDWQTTYSSVLGEDFVAGTSGVVGRGPGTFAFTSQSFGRRGCDQVAPLGFPACSGAISAQGPAPAFEISGASTSKPLPFHAQSVTGIGESACHVGVDRDLSVLESVLPGALTANGTLPAHALDGGGTYTAHVSSAQADPPAPSNCAGSGRTAPGTIGCSSSLSWTGTVTFAPDCRKRGEPASATAKPDCLSKKHKDEADKAAQEYTQQAKADAVSFNTLGCRHGVNLGGYRNGQAGACSGMGIALAYESAMAQQYRQIAHDPPDAGYRRVVRARPPHVKGLKALRRFSSATYRLMRRYLKVAGLASAVMTSQNRATGAYVALLKGDEKAAAPLAKQDRAVLTYAAKAARVLDGQHRLARRASTELRHAASHIHVHRLVAGIRSLAAALVSRRTTDADERAAAALRGIGR